MKEKILAFLKTKLQKEIVKFGVQDDYLIGVAEAWAKTIKEEKDIETTFTEPVLETLTFSALQLQSVGDKRINQAKLDLKAWQKEHGLNEDGTPVKKETKTKEVKTETTDEMPEWAKKILADNTELKTKIENQEKEHASSLLIDKVRKHEKLKDIPASYLKGRNLIPKSEGDIDQLVADLRTDYDSFYQEQVEAGVIVSVPKSSVEGNKDGEKVGKEAADKRNKKASDGVEAKKL